MRQETYVLPDGLMLSDVVRPVSVDGVAEVLRSASEHGIPVLPIGGGTSLATGNAVEHAFLGMDLRGLSGVRQYEPTDLTASFWAGTTIADVVAALAEHDQELPVDMPQVDQGTIGGLIATAFSGPRRFGSGTLKDLLIGCGYVRGDGLVAKAGGMLVKNVSGFEISRLLHGSWGSLAVLTSINLKVVPQPKADVTFTQRYRTLSDALVAQRRVVEGYLTAYASVIQRDGEAWALHLRLLGRRGSLQAQVQSLYGQMGTDGQLTEGSTFWRAYNDRWATDNNDVRMVLGTRPHAVETIGAEVSSWDGVLDVSISLPTGSVRLALDPDIVSLQEVRDRLRSFQEVDALTWVVELAPRAWKASRTVWGPEHPSMPLMRSIKREFDPGGILNRGRLFI